MSQLHIASAAASSATKRGTDNAPLMLVRTMRGRITLWSPAMQQRYGFSVDEAMGQSAHQLLRTLFLKPPSEIDAILVERKSWSGGAVHRRADGRLVMTAHHWHLHDRDGREALVSELHSDIASTDEDCANVLADIIGVIGHELSQPLTAINSYIHGASRALQPAWPDKVSSSQALTAAAEQMARIKEGMALFRELGETLRPSGAAPVAAPAGQAEQEPALGE